MRVSSIIRDVLEHHTWPQLPLHEDKCHAQARLHSCQFHVGHLLAYVESSDLNLAGVFIWNSWKVCHPN